MANANSKRAPARIPAKRRKPKLRLVSTRTSFEIATHEANMIRFMQRMLADKEATKLLREQIGGSVVPPVLRVVGKRKRYPLKIPVGMQLYLKAVNRKPRNR